MVSDLQMRVVKQLKNPLLERRQLLVEVTHPTVNPTREAIRDLTLKKFKLKESEKKPIVVFGCKTAFGGGRTRAFVLIYDSFDAAMKTEPRHRKIKKDGLVGEAKDTRVNRRLKREAKNRRKKVKGIKKELVKAGAKK